MKLSIMITLNYIKLRKEVSDIHRFNKAFLCVPCMFVLFFGGSLLLKKLDRI